MLWTPPAANAFLSGHERDGSFQLAGGNGSQVHDQRGKLPLNCLHAAKGVPSVEGHQNDPLGRTPLGHLPLPLRGGEQPFMLTPLHLHSFASPQA